MTAERKAALLAYCRIDGLEPMEELLLMAAYADAVSYMDQAGISEPPEGSARRAQYDMCVNRMVLDAWDSRGTVSDGKMVENLAFRRSLNQLKMTESDVSNSDASDPGEESAAHVC